VKPVDAGARRVADRPVALGEGEYARTLQRLIPVHGNSARSIMAEAILNSKAAKFYGLQRGSHPSGTVRPEALRQLEMAHLPTEGLRSKAWRNSLCPVLQGSTSFYGVRQRRERGLPIWPTAMTAHWAFRPAALRTEEEVERRFARHFYSGSENQPIALPSLKSLDGLASRELDKIGQTMTPVPHEYSVFIAAAARRSGCSTLRAAMKTTSRLSFLDRDLTA